MTAIASDEPDGNVFVSGFGDGVVRLFDKRMQNADNIVMRVWRQHHTWIQSVHLQKGGQRELITGRWAFFSHTWIWLMISMNGEIRIWDVRAPEKPLYEKLAQSNGLAGLAVHSGAPVFATYVFYGLLGQR